MSSTADSPASSPPHNPPYPPRFAGLGGIPTILLDVPISAVLLAVYLVLGIIHIKIFKNNKGRGHKFIFSGALLGLCKIRVISMALRIAWACHPRSIPLAMAANIFVYVGTIILYMMNWFFTQRIVRAQHTKLGWSTPYRIFHRAALACLMLNLISLIIASIWQFFTLDPEHLHVFRYMQLTSQTYFTVMSFAPIVVVLISLALPRREVEKFGAGRLRINITILILSAAILATGQIFRCVTTWLPPTPLLRAGQPVEVPWYYHKACFYTFNFATELLVITMYAVVRIDLRFHVPNGSKMAGDYSNRNSLASVNHLNATEKAIKATLASMSQINSSSETIHAYQSSVFDDSCTLADSLQYPSSTLTIDEKTGSWKVKRASGASSGSQRSSRSSLHPDRHTLVDEDIPPVPHLPTAWPLPSSKQPHDSVPVMEHTNSYSSRGTSKRNYELKGHALNDVDINDAIPESAISNTLSLLEANSEKNKLNTRTPPPQYSDGDANSSTGGSIGRSPSSSTKHKSFSHPHLSRGTYPPVSAYETSSSSSATPIPPRKPRVYIPSYPPGTQHNCKSSSSVPPTEPAASLPAAERRPSLDIVKLVNRISREDSDPPIFDASLITQESIPGSYFNSTRCSSITRRTLPQSPVGYHTHQIDADNIVRHSSLHTSRTASSEALRAEEAFKGFDFDAGFGGSERAV